MRGLVLFLMIAAGCSEPERVATPPVATPAPAPAPEPVVPDAGLPPPDAAVPQTSCTFRGALEQIELITDPATRIGTLKRESPGRNHRREIGVQLVSTSATDFDLVFLEYGPHDYAPIHQWHGPDKPREKLTPGKSVVARLYREGDLMRIQDRDVDLHTEMKYVSPDNSYPCGTMNEDFDRAHPGERTHIRTR